MAVPYRRTIASLRGDRGRNAAVGLAVGAFVLLAWSAWLAFARVSVLAVSESARVATALRTHPVAPSTGGIIVESRLALGRAVVSGAPLVLLDSIQDHSSLTTETEALSSARSRIESAEAELDALGREAAASQESLEASLDASRADAAAARERAAEALRRARRLSSLLDSRAVSRAEYEAARSEAAALEAEAQALAARARARQEELAEMHASAALSRTRIESELAQARSAARQAESAILRAEDRLGRRVVRAPISGRIAEVADISPGAVVESGQRLALIVPDDSLIVRARFAAGELGRIRPGQRALLRLDAFPWTEFGAVPLEVSGVASETRPDGLVDVDLTIVGDLPSSGLHAATGAVEVETEYVHPYQLVLRAAGLVGARP